MTETNAGSPTKEYSIDDPEVIGRLVLNTDLLQTFISSLDATKPQERQALVGALQDLASDLIQEGATEVRSWNCVGAYDDPFDVTVWQCAGIYFVTANEFDDRGYFLELGAAEAAASDIADAFPPEE